MDGLPFGHLGGGEGGGGGVLGQVLTAAAAGLAGEGVEFAAAELTPTTAGAL